MHLHLLPLSEIQRVVQLSQQLPEFHHPYPAVIYQQRLAKVPHLILVATVEGQDAGFKVGYQREADGSFYSWMGGILPRYRRQGIAQALADRQENWAREQGYSRICFKTLNRHKKMLSFALGNGFWLTGVDPHADPMENRIWLAKSL